MIYDMYDEDLPEIEKSWAAQLKESRDLLILAAKIVGVPTGLFILTCVGNYYLNKKLESL